jgi:hypothetical protein
MQPIFNSKLRYVAGVLPFFIQLILSGAAAPVVSRPVPVRAGRPREQAANSGLAEYFRCPDDFARLVADRALAPEEGYFAFQGLTCWGQAAAPGVVRPREGSLVEVADRVRFEDGSVILPFALDQIIFNLRTERYRQDAQGFFKTLGDRVAQALYYSVRPALPVHIRKHLQRVRLSHWDRIPFPHWPVDSTVDDLLERTAALALRSRGADAMPFIWFWPDGAAAAAMMTHDVETDDGVARCAALMDDDEAANIRSAFQIIPERYRRSCRDIAEEIRRRGFEVNVHDLNHDGRLYRDKAQFFDKAAQINRYARELCCEGFRSGGMYRRQEWYEAFEFSYDMSVPSVAHLEPQRGGCCTVMPYFVGDVLELPLTTTQDYSLFHILDTYSVDLLREQSERILAKHGLISFIVHPDYLDGPKARAAYIELLSYLDALRRERHVWMAPPDEINRWWRNRQQMTLVRRGDAWQVEGPGSERARVGWATLSAGDRLTYSVDGPPA